MRKRILAAVGAAAVVVSATPAHADPFPGVPVFCFRITDIERCPDDISGAAFIVEFEVLNWTDTPACGLTINATVGVFMAFPPWIPIWSNGVPLITKARVDPDGRGGRLGGFDIGPGIFDPVAIHSGRGRGDIGGHLNDWFVTPVGGGLTGHYTVTWSAPGLPALGSCIPNRDVLLNWDLLPDLDPKDDAAQIQAIFEATYLLIPGLGTDALGDSAIDGGPAPYTPPDPLPPFPTGGPPVPDGSGNVLDGFTIEVCDWHPGEMLILNWWLLDETLVPIGSGAGGNSYAFGTMGLIRLPPGAPPPVGAPFSGNTGFVAGGTSFFDGVWSVPAGIGPAGHPPADFAIELGAGLTAPEPSADPNPHGAPINSNVTWTDGWHPTNPFCPWDSNGDGVVGINDFLDLLGAWGPCPFPN